MKKLLSISLMALLALGVAACGKKDKPAKVGAAEGAFLMEYVPADTPYMIASLQPAPDAYVEKMEPVMEAIAEMMTSLGDAMDEGAEDASPEQLAFINGLVSIYSLFSPEMLQEFGIGMKSVGVLYGNGLLPVIRVRLQEPERFVPRLEQHFEENGISATKATAAGIDYHQVAIGEGASMLVARDDNMAVVTMALSSFEEPTLASLLGATKPASSMASGAPLRALADEYGYLSYMLGFIDFEAIVAEFVGTPTGVTNALFEATGNPAASLDDVCRRETAALAGVAPRLVLGYNEFTDERVGILPVLELRDDIAKAMQPIATVVPGMGADTDALFKFGFGANLSAMRAYVDTIVAPVVEKPFQCAQLANLNMAASSMVQATQQPLPPIADNFRGLFAEFDDLDGIDFSSPTPPKSLDAALLIAFDNVEGLLQMGQMFMPPLAAMELTSNGEAVAVPRELLGPYEGATFVAMTDNLLALTSGDGAASRASSLASQDDEGTPLLFTMSFDMVGYMNLLSQAQEAAAEEGADDPMAAKFEAAGDKLMQAYTEAFERERIDVTATARGLEFPTVITLK